jgi:hypothetical protein
LGLALKGPEKPFRERHPAPCVSEPNRDSLRLAASADCELLVGFLLHCTFTVFDEIQEDLHQALPVRPNSRKIPLDFPVCGHAGITQRWLDNDT